MASSCRDQASQRSRGRCGALLVELGVRESDVILESHARTTYENATETWALLAARKLEGNRVVVVTEAIHMPRDELLPRRGFRAIAAPCRLRNRVFLSSRHVRPDAKRRRGFDRRSPRVVWVGLVLHSWANLNPFLTINSPKMAVQRWESTGTHVNHMLNLDAILDSPLKSG